MTRKFPICPDRIRTIPEQFSWVDHRLVRDRHIEQLSHEAAALYLFLVTVADSQGMSYYSDASLQRRLALDEQSLAAARSCLARTRLALYRKPFYQVLPLADSPVVRKRGRTTEGPMSIADVLQGIIGGAQ